MSLDELIALGERLSAPIGDPTNWDQVTLSWFRSSAGAGDAKFIHAACNAIIPLARDHQSALEKIGRLREILGPKLEYAIQHESISYSVMIGPFSERQAEELSAILTALA